MRLLCVTLGGPRLAAMEEQAEALGFSLTKVDGVDGPALSKLEALEEHAGDILDALGVSVEARHALGRLCKDLHTEQRRVLGCTLAHLRAMHRSSEADGAYDMVVEDNARLLSSFPGYETAAAEAGASSLLYWGWLGHDDNLAQIATLAEKAAAVGQAWAEVPLWQGSESSGKDGRSRRAEGAEGGAGADGEEGGVDGEGEDGEGAEQGSGERDKAQTGGHSKFTRELFFGAYAVRYPRALWEAMRQEVASALEDWAATKGRSPGNPLFRKRRWGRRTVIEVQPVDKLTPRVARAAGIPVCVLSAGARVYRMPSLGPGTDTMPSKIHTKWDERYYVSTTGQLRQLGLSWEDVWLTTGERRAVQERLAADAARGAVAASPGQPADAKRSEE